MGLGAQLMQHIGKRPLQADSFRSHLPIPMTAVIGIGHPIFGAIDSRAPHDAKSAWHYCAKRTARSKADAKAGSMTR